MPKASEISRGLATYHAIFAIDPGNHTGLASSWVPMAGSVRSSMVARLRRESATLEGDELDQALGIWKLWEAFRRSSYTAGIPHERHHLVIERFTLRGGSHAGGRDGTSPERITWAFEGYRRGRFDTYRQTKHLTPVTWQEPGVALTFGTRPRLESWEAWVKGKEHERTAYAHLAVKVRSLLGRARD